MTNNTETVNHPSHYGGKDNPYEVIKVIENCRLGFHLGNVLKYVARAGKKGDELTDLKKAQWYLSRYIEWWDEQQRRGWTDTKAKSFKPGLDEESITHTSNVIRAWGLGYELGCVVDALLHSGEEPHLRLGRARHHLALRIAHLTAAADIDTEETKLPYEEGTLDQAWLLLHNLLLRLGGSGGHIDLQLYGDGSGHFHVYDLTDARVVSAERGESSLSRKRDA